MERYNIDRFIKAQQQNFEIAFEEIKQGRKKSHWIWYIFPQIKGLGFSKTARYYSIENLEEAKQYLENKYLYKNLILICNELLKIENKDIIDIMGNIDSLKLCSSMTLFHIIDPNEKVFIEIIEKYYNNIQDEKTISNRIICFSGFSACFLWR